MLSHSVCTKLKYLDTCNLINCALKVIKKQKTSCREAVILDFQLWSTCVWTPIPRQSSMKYTPHSKLGEPL